MFNSKEKIALKSEIDTLIQKEVIVEVQHSHDEFISSVFLRPKPNGTKRMILNLKDVNEFIVYHHFKMDIWRKL